MRIGILTLPLHTNYGGILQAWALQTVLQRMGHEVEVLGRKEKLVNGYIILPLRWCLRLFRKYFFNSDIPIFAEVKAKRIRQQKAGNIYSFIRKRINHKLIDTPRSIPANRYDTIVVGSDQIWRKQCISDVWGTDDYLSVFLPNSKYKSINKISYAASFGLSHWEYSKEESAIISHCLSRFSAVSVRELSAIDLLKENAEIKAKFVLDPTMLLSSDDYIKELNIELKNGPETIVSYILDANASTSLLIDKVKKAKGIRHVELNAIRENGSKPSIEEWISTIATSSIVVTDSFHGCVFSIIFRKPLVFITNEHRGNARFESLIKSFGIESNCVDANPDINFSQSFDLPPDISERIASLKQISMEYITKSL